MGPSDLRKRIRSYEDCYRPKLPGRMPTIYRCDGRSMHTLTHNWVHPWDEVMKECMDAAALALCQEISGAQLAYTESDEITVFARNYNQYSSQPWFGNDLIKMVATSATTATVAFNRRLRDFWERVVPGEPGPDGVVSYRKPYQNKEGTFDSRVFVVSREEVANVFIDRQVDCERNSVLSLGQFIFGKKAVQGLSCRDIKERLIAKAQGLSGVYWESCENWQKYGRIVIKEDNNWVVKPAPIFRENRKLIDSLVWPEDEEGKYSTPVTLEEQEE